MLYASVALYIAAIATPGLVSDAFFSVMALYYVFTGFIGLLSGIGFLSGIFWLANPLLFIAWYYYTRSPKLSIIFSTFSLCFWCSLLFSFSSDVSYGLWLAYIFGLLSICVILIVSLNQYKPVGNL